MQLLFDKIICLFISILLSFYLPVSIFYIIPLLSIISISSYKIVYPTKKINYGFLCFYFILCLYSVSFTVYLPVLLYDWYSPKYKYVFFILFCIPAIFHVFHFPIASGLICASYIPVMMIRHKTDQNMHLQTEYQMQRDSSKEVSILMEQKNKELMIRQDQEIHIATLNERNRIARDIHDTVGHLLSSSLLQVGAIETMNQQDALVKPILDIKSTLTQGLDAVRKSVHNLYKDAIDLESEIQKLVDSFTTCDIEYIYDLITPLSQTNTYHVIAIIKEALHNVMKHSNADKVNILCHEHPVFYQFVISDNGTHIVMNSNGIGLQNMQHRIDLIHGYFNYQTQHGFEIFITIPKEEHHEHYNN